MAWPGSGPSTFLFLFTRFVMECGTKMLALQPQSLHTKYVCVCCGKEGRKKRAFLSNERCLPSMFKRPAL